MTKQAIIAVVVAVVIVLGAGGAFLYSKNKPASQPNSTTATQSANEESSMSSDLTSILKSGKTQQCSFSYDEQNGNSTSGVTYLSSDKMRTDINSTTNGKSSTIYVIRNGDDNYIWGSEFPNNTGMKMTMSIDEYASNTDSKKYFDPTKKIDYSCSGWTIDSSVFTPPSNVKFQDFSAMIEGVMKAVSKTPTGAQGNSEQCNICNSLTGDAKTTCRTQLNCK